MKEKIKTKCIAFLMCSVLLCFSASVFAQSGTGATGRVIDKNGEGLIGATVTVVGSARGAITDENGDFEIANVPSGTKLKITYLGMEDKEQVFSGKPLTIVLEEQKNELDEVTIVGFGKQQKESVVSSISTVDVSELRVPSSNLTTSFAGRIAGMISYQTSGEPGAASNAEFFVRGVTSFAPGLVQSPLILIDNIEVSTDDLARLHPDDLQSFSVLKDATATALYGARGANGVILVTTKEGKEGKATVSFRVENTWSAPTSQLEMADAITYMNMANEAYNTRVPYITNVYPRSDINETALGNYPVAYPNVDWMKLMIKDVTNNQRANISVSGGGKVARYYVSGSFANDNGLIKTDKRSSFDNNINSKQYTLHSNVNVNVTQATEMIIRLHGGFSDYQGPLESGSGVYKSVLKVSPVRFLPYYEPDLTYAKANHILFGNDGSQSHLFVNPYAEMMKGYQQNSSSSLMAQMELKQDFSQILKGLRGRVLGNTARNSYFRMNREFKPYYYELMYFDRTSDMYYLYELNTGSGTEYLGYDASKNEKSITNVMYGEAALSYDNSFDVNTVSGMLVLTGRNYVTPNADKLLNSLPERNVCFSGRFTYNYDKRYFAEFNFGYNGSEKFDKGHRWGFFPSIGLGYLMSNETFWSELKDKITMLKWKYTYGMTGNDKIANQRFFYLSNIEMGKGDGFGDNAVGFGTTGAGFAGMQGPLINNYENPNVTWEIAYKHNFGIELGLYNKVNIQADIYKEHRKNILQERQDIPISLGLWSVPLLNKGEAQTVGGEISLDYNQTFNKDLWFTGRANFTYAHSEYAVYEEPNYESVGAPWRSKIGRTTTQQEGYIAERLFIDQADIDNSPTQTFGVTMPGDIKYKDLNGDGQIDELDKRGIGYPTTPELQYGFGFSLGYKRVDLSAFFQGSARSSFFIDPKAMMPYKLTVLNNGAGPIEETGLAKFIADDYWSEQNNNPYAAWPRLASTEEAFKNNLEQSTFWMYDNNYMRFKTLELGYTVPEATTKKMHLSSLRFYVSGTNLFLISNFKIWDVELGGNGLNYPLQRTVNVGVNLKF
jgi:TonB-linked SusC/RagA family outer membrane protein